MFDGYARGEKQSASSYQRAIRALPSLSVFFPRCIACDFGTSFLHDSASQLEIGTFDDIEYDRLCEHIRVLADNLAQVREEHEAEDEISEDLFSKDKRNHRQLCRQVWRPVRRRITIARVS